MLASTSILLVLDCGVMLALNPMVAGVLLVDVNCVLVVPVTTCKILNAPLTSFICAAVNICAVLKLAGRFVGVAIN